MRRGRLLQAGVLAVALGPALASPPARAATIVVTTVVDTAGGPACSLRDAIVAANLDEAWGGCPAGDGDDVIDLTGLSGTMEVHSTLPTIGGSSESTVVRGPGADRLAISGLDAHPVLSAESGSQGTAIEGLTIRDGSPTCVQAGGFLMVRDSRITSCVGDGGGAGIDMGLTGFRLLVDRSLLDGNTGGWAIRTGGTAGSGILVLLSSTVSDNDSGIAILNNEGANTSFIHSSTIADNRGVNLLVQPDQRVSLVHTILKHDPGRPRGDPPGVNCVLQGVMHLPPGTPNLDSFASLSDDGSCGLLGPGDLEPVDPLLGPLADGGGPTASRAPLAGSPAIDAGESSCFGPDGGELAVDQRGPGFPRPLPGAPGAPARCDLGAIEVGVAVPEPDAGATGAAALLTALGLGRRRRGVRRWATRAARVTPSRSAPRAGCRSAS